MSWTLVSQTDSGYKKYRDQYGNNRYLDPDGNFTNQNAWAGTQSHGAEELPEFGGGVGTPINGKIRDERNDLESYENAEDIVFDEPYENDYIPPVDFPFGSNAYPIEDYPGPDRLDMLVEEIEDNPGFDHYSMAVVAVIYSSDGEILSRGERHTNLLPKDDVTQLRAEWATMIRDISAAASGYGGAAIFKSKVKMRLYKE